MNLSRTKIFLIIEILFFNNKFNNSNVISYKKENNNKINKNEIELNTKFNINDNDSKLKIITFNIFKEKLKDCGNFIEFLIMGYKIKDFVFVILSFLLNQNKYSKISENKVSI